MSINEPSIFWNPWRHNKNDWLHTIKLDAMAVIRELVKRKEILAITGVLIFGKSTVLHLVVKMLLHDGLSPRNILHLNLEDPAFTGIFLPS
jgi:predicted AAA+ superfamily ATPase